MEEPKSESVAVTHQQIQERAIQIHRGTDRQAVLFLRDGLGNPSYVCMHRSDFVRERIANPSHKHAFGAIDQFRADGCGRSVRAPLKWLIGLELRAGEKQSKNVSSIPIV